MSEEVSKTLVDLTVQDCINFYEHEGYVAVCNDGQLDGFVKEYDQAQKLEFIWFNKSQ